MRKRNATGIVFFAFVVMFCSGFLLAQMTVDIGSAKDNTLYENLEGSLSNGAGNHFFAGKSGNTTGASIRRGLLAFDIAGNIPAGSTINSVTLNLNMSRTVSGNVDVTLHKVLADWGEGTSHASGEEGGGAQATPGDATWVFSFFTSTLWTNLGGDFSATASASQSVNALGMYTWGSTPEMVADVQDWLDNPANNFGWLVMGDEVGASSAKRFDTRENTTPANRPVLTVNYTPPTGIDHIEDGLPLKFELAQNYPNPFNPTTNIRFRIANSGFVSLKIYDSTGKEVAELVGENLSAGSYSYSWDAKVLASGVYFYHLDAGNNSAVRKMLLIR